MTVDTRQTMRAVRTCIFPHAQRFVSSEMQAVRFVRSDDPRLARTRTRAGKRAFGDGIGRNPASGFERLGMLALVTVHASNSLQQRALFREGSARSA
jgi:hypothetical protein